MTALAAVAAGGTASADGGGTSAGGGSRGADTGGTRLAGQPAGAEVVLATGQRVTVGPGGATSARDAGLSWHTGADGDRYAVPAAAGQYLGRPLDRSLFDVTELAKLGAGHRIPVRMTFAAGVTPSAPPGVTVTAVDGDTADGYLTAASTRTFGAAVRAAIGADVRAGRPAGSGELVPGMTGMRLASAAAQRVSPHYQQAIVQFDATDLTGAAATTGVLLVNTDDARRTDVYVPVVDGVGRIAVPVGHYSFTAPFRDFDEQGEQTGLHYVVGTDVTVEAGTTTTVPVAEAAATARVSVATPRPTVPAQAMIRLVRQDAAGVGVEDMQGVAAGDALYVSPQPAAQVGRLHYVVQWSGQSPAGAEAYRYDVAFGFDRIPADESLQVAPSQLATIHQHFFGDPAQADDTGMLYSGAYDDMLAHTPTLLNPSPVQQMPGEVTDYVGTSDGGGWIQAIQNGNRLPFWGQPHRYVAGHEYHVDWGRGPLVPGVGRYPEPAGCVACVAGDTFDIGLQAAVDSDGHATGYMPRGATTRFRLYRNGTVVADRPMPYLDGQLTADPAQPATFRMRYEMDQRAVGTVSQATRSVTDVRFRYSPDTAVAMPAPASCPGQTVDTPCRVLPVLTANYRLAVDAHNTSDLATQTMRLRVGHQRYGKFGSSARITAVKVELSTDGGASWHRARVSGDDGRYRVSWTNPAAARGSSPSLRLTATDALGGSLTQTITAAYTIAG
ncbi:hypothetical protein Athai_02900 [Actinocatenispora thailandica]|uniref:Uncharacterized protein n=1 Tax=Actinocatenispora thailandica TaxID=227318 RepID=A0A7R7DJD8_9ACTN|nr:hypothetical protein [Actinocatenispora thailandica]BCJ32787.1 hypothetical protein Athai_02900 [Actinocatenispora thailandica]